MPNNSDVTSTMVRTQPVTASDAMGPTAEQAGARRQRVADTTSTQASTLEPVPLKFIRFKGVRNAPASPGQRFGGARGSARS